MKNEKNVSTGLAEKRVEVLFKWIMFTAAITGMAIIAAFYPIQANLPLIVVPSILVLIFAKPVFFERLKLMTLVAMRILIVFATLNLINRQSYVNVILIMLIVNILEATFTDLLRHKKYFNAISGFAVAIGVFVLQGHWLDNASVGQYYVTYAAVPLATLFYVIAYTIWNWIFVTNEFSDSVSLMHVGFLSAPLIAGLCTLALGPAGGLGIWLLIRANSLSIGGWMQIGAKTWFEKEFHDDKFAAFVNWTKRRPIQMILMLVNVLLIAAAVYLSVRAGGAFFGFLNF